VAGTPEESPVLVFVAKQPCQVAVGVWRRRHQRGRRILHPERVDRCLAVALQFRGRAGEVRDGLPVRCPGHLEDVAVTARQGDDLAGHGVEQVEAAEWPLVAVDLDGSGRVLVRLCPSLRSFVVDDERYAGPVG
jgi:hypothetical protein